MSWSLQASGSCVPAGAADMSDEQAAALQLGAERDLADALEAALSPERYGTVTAKFAGQYMTRTLPPPPPPEPAPPPLSLEEQLAAALARISALEGTS